MIIDLDIVYVNYFSLDKLINSIESFFTSLKKECFRINIFIIDNSYRETAEKEDYKDLLNLNKKYSEINFNLRIIKNLTNIGFGSGCNLGASLGKSNKILFLNCDTIFTKDKNFTKNFINFLNTVNDKVPISAPMILNKNTNKEISYFSFDPFFIVIKPINHLFKLNKFLKFLNFRFISNYLNKMAYANRKDNQPVFVDWVSGCSMLIQRDFFESINGFDPIYFLYFEDIDICRMAREKSKKVLYYPKFKMIHFGNYESSKKSGVLNSIISNKTTRYHISSWLKYLIKWRKDLLHYKNTKYTIFENAE